MTNFTLMKTSSIDSVINCWDKIKIKEAIEIFKMNVEMYPESWNVYDSLGEGYMNDEQKELAIKNYEKSLELNPDNENGKAMLRRLGIEL